MGLPDLKTKLGNELKKEICDESQVVYILSRIRKILEITGKGSEFKILKLYCDWALHSSIDNTDSLREMLKGVIEQKDEYLIAHITFQPFDKEFKLFLKSLNLSTTIYDQGNGVALRKFKRLLTQIYEDTPLILKTVEKTKITICEIDETRATFNVNVKIEKLS